ncbi:VOC family protein [Leptolyngbya sp. NIES-2104]|uniref:VOC family protein n=1 Tax=Leptolyngbya sp. NIES-2104 TaxID=1552121 RepID=UPI00073EC13A|nr:VOC family protein [Leptolyngbya sp. NIES-2104]
MDNNPSILSHVSIGTNDFERAIAFYDAVLTPLGCKRLMEYPGALASLHGYVFAYGKQYPEFWMGTPFDGQPATVGNGTHIGFIASTKEAVHAFYEAALAAGGVDEGAPGGRPDYSEPYYGCFVRDRDGHKVEAAFWDTQLEQALNQSKSG